MTQPTIEAHKITKPIQILAVWFVGLVLLVGAFLAAAATISTPDWVPGILVVAAIAIVFVFSILIFLLQTRFRTQFLDDDYYAEWLKRNEKEFEGFKPENVDGDTPSRDASIEGSVSLSSDLAAEHSSLISKVETWQQREDRRKQIYTKNRGIFLVHAWRPSRFEDQVVDISISISQHRDGPLREGKVESVEYHLGAKFFRQPVRKTNRQDNFRLDISAYGPVLCLARVNFNDGSPPLDLERYINFS